MSIQTLTLAGRDFIVIPRREYERLRVRAGETPQQDQQDAADVATAKRRRKEPTRPYSDLRKELGLT